MDKSTYTCIGAQAALQWYKIEFWQFFNQKLIKQAHIVKYSAVSGYDFCHGSDFAIEIIHKAVVAKHLYVVKKSQHKPSYAGIAAHGHVEPVPAVFISRYVSLGGRIFLLKNIIGQLPKKHAHRHLLFAAEHEYVGVHLAVAVFKNPL